VILELLPEKFTRVRAPVQHNLKTNGIIALSAKPIKLESMMWDKIPAGYIESAAHRRTRCDSAFPYTTRLYWITFEDTCLCWFQKLF